MKKYCGHCKKSFQLHSSNQKFCSRECYWNAYLGRQRKRREEKPEWYQSKEPKYYRTYRAKLHSSRPWNYLLQSARLRAKGRGIEFSISHEWAKARWTGRCEITGLEFRANGKRGPFPFSPSIDRIDQTKGYTEANTRFILWGCNAIRGVGSDADMHEIAKSIVASNSTDVAC